MEPTKPFDSSQQVGLSGLSSPGPATGSEKTVPSKAGAATSPKAMGQVPTAPWKPNTPEAKKALEAHARKATAARKETDSTQHKLESSTREITTAHYNVLKAQENVKLINNQKKLQQALEGQRTGSKGKPGETVEDLKLAIKGDILVLDLLSDAQKLNADSPQVQEHYNTTLATLRNVIAQGYDPGDIQEQLPKMQLITSPLERTWHQSSPTPRDVPAALPKMKKLEKLSAEWGSKLKLAEKAETVANTKFEAAAQRHENARLNERMANLDFMKNHVTAPLDTVIPNIIDANQQLWDINHGIDPASEQIQSTIDLLSKDLKTVEQSIKASKTNKMPLEDVANLRIAALHLQVALGNLSAHVKGQDDFEYQTLQKNTDMLDKMMR